MAGMKFEPFDIRSALPAMLATPRDRTLAWWFITGFAAYWGRPLGAGDGWDPAVVDAAERRLGLTLPAALREAYQLFGRRDDLTSNQDRLLPPDELYVWDGALVYREENQGCAHWGIPLADFDERADAVGEDAVGEDAPRDDAVRDDPRTVARPDLADKSQERWEPWMPSLAAACVEIVMAEALMDPDAPTDFLDTDGEGLAPEVAALCDPLQPFGPGSRWFAGTDVLIREVDDAFVCVRGRTPEALDPIREAQFGDWLDD